MSYSFQQTANDPSMTCYTYISPFIRRKQVIEELTGPSGDLGRLFLVVGSPEFIGFGEIGV
jgi:hypothetical protein